jgi:cyclomaltodextrinase
MANPLDTLVVYEVAARNFGENGTIAEITEAVPSLRDLGVDVVYLQPVCPVGKKNRKGNDGSLYAIRDYTAIGPELGTEDDLVALLEAAHAAGMRVVMDVVFNHLACDAGWVTEHPEWFLADDEGPTRRFEDWTDIYDLDWTRDDVKAALIDVLHHWVGLGADGFRCDVAGMLPLDFWREARASFGGRDVLLIAESFAPSYVRLLRDRHAPVLTAGELCEVFDLTYDFDGYEVLSQYRRGEIGLGEYLRFLDRQLDAYPTGAVKLRFLENHDLPRIAGVVTSPASLRAWTLFSLLLPGAFMLSAGQEAGLAEPASRYDRSPFPWEDGDDEFRLFFAGALKVAREVKGGAGGFAVSEAAGGVARIDWSGTTHHVAILNLEDRAGTIDLGERIEGRDVLTGERVSIGPVHTIGKRPLLIARTDGGGTPPRIGGILELAAGAS